MTTYDLILHFVSLELTAIRVQAKFDVPNFNGSRDTIGSQNFTTGLRETHMTPFDLILHFFFTTHCLRLDAKFEVSSFSRSRDMRGFQKF